MTVIQWEKEKQPYKVGDKYRTNKLSHQPGGVKVFVKYKSGFVKEYDKIKNPDKFIDKITESNDSSIVNVWYEK